MTGIQPPNYTQIPNEILDRMAEFSPAEFKVIMAICRQTFGWHKEWDVISFSQLEKLTGLSRTAISDAIQAGIERGWLERTPVNRKSYSYRLVVSGYQSAETTSSPGLPPEVASGYHRSVASGYTQKKDTKERKESSGGRDSEPAIPPPPQKAEKATPSPRSVQNGQIDLPTTPSTQKPEKSTFAAAASPNRNDGLDTETHKVVVRLMKLGMSEALACRAIEANAFDDATLVRLEEWSLAKRKEGRMSPGAWLNARLPHGILPDDLPVPPPEKRPAIELVWLEPIGGGSRIAVPSTTYEANRERYAHMEEV